MKITTLNVVNIRDLLTNEACDAVLEDPPWTFGDTPYTLVDMYAFIDELTMALPGANDVFVYVEAADTWALSEERWDLVLRSLGELCVDAEAFELLKQVLEDFIYDRPMPVTKYPYVNLEG